MQTGVRFLAPTHTSWFLSTWQHCGHQTLQTMTLKTVDEQTRARRAQLLPVAATLTRQGPWFTWFPLTKSFFRMWGLYIWPM